MEVFVHPFTLTFLPDLENNWGFKVNNIRISFTCASLLSCYLCILLDKLSYVQFKWLVNIEFALYKMYKDW